MKKAVLIAIQPYYVFLIIARLMGWNISQEKTVEVRKGFPKDPAWDNVAHIYCSRNRKSFNQIPKQYQPFMQKFLGKVIGEFVCDAIEKWNTLWLYGDDVLEKGTCLTDEEIMDYMNNFLDRSFFLWRISDLKIYDKPKELGEFKRNCGQYGSDNPLCDGCKYFIDGRSYEYDESDCAVCGHMPLARPPQSWCYVEADT